MNQKQSLKIGEVLLLNKGEVLEKFVENGFFLYIFDQQQKIGGATHFIFSNFFESKKSNVNENFFADKAVINLLKELKNKKCMPENLKASLFYYTNNYSKNEDKLIAEIVENVLHKFRIHLIRSKSFTMPFKIFLDPQHEIIQEQNLQDSLVSHIKSRIKVLIVDDSIAVQKVLHKSLNQFPEIEVVGLASSAIEAEKLRIDLKPDVMTLDIHMPEKDGILYLTELMKISKIPVIMVSDLNFNEASGMIKCLELGAFDYFQKPSYSQIEEKGIFLKELIKAAFLYQKKNQQKKTRTLSFSKRIHLEKKFNFICIGASTGGTEAIREILKHLPANTPPIAIVIHMPPHFTKTFAQSLSKLCLIEVKEAENGMILKENCAYIAPGAHQIKIIENSKNELEVLLTDDPPLNRFKPSVDYFFNSIAQLKNLNQTVGVILTGMGEDGARGLLALKKAGVFTIAQNEESCVVFGMPKAAIELNAVQAILALEDIADHLIQDSPHKKIS